MAIDGKKNTLKPRATLIEKLRGTQGGKRPYSPKHKILKWGPNKWSISEAGEVTDLSKKDAKIIKKLSRRERNTLYKALGVTDVKQKRAESLKKQQLGSSMKHGGKVRSYNFIN